jgi:DNA-binding protein HU-beta
MNKARLIEKIAAESAVTKKQAEDMLDTLVDTIISELKVGNEVTITGFGTFLSRIRHARGGVNPQNPSERIQIPEVKVAKFKTGKTLKDALKGKI